MTGPRSISLDEILSSIPAAPPPGDLIESTMRRLGGHPPTDEQRAIAEAALDRRDSIMVNALAGCAKTSTLELIANLFANKLPALALAFNVKIKKELERRFPSNFTVLTLNGLGHRAWSTAIGRRCQVDEDKLHKLIKAQAAANGFQLTGDQWSEVRQLISVAMNSGLIPRPFSERFQGFVPDEPGFWKDLAEEAFLTSIDGALIDLARSVLIESIKLAYQGVLSFDDQIYCSTMLSGVFPRFPLVLVDESQDLSPLNHIQLKRSAADRIISVGDPKQAIYAFRGADSASMAKIKALRPSWIELPLKTTFRCPKAIVQRQQAHAPGFTAWHTNKDGVVLNWREAQNDAAVPNWTWEQVEALRQPGETVVIICRNNAPLLSMAFKLIRKGIGCFMLGRDIGKGLVALSKKLIPNDRTDAAECARLIQGWAEHEIAIARANDKEDKIAGITDRAECLMAVLESAQAKDAGALRRHLTDLFSREHGTVQLASGHRSKGLEWDINIHLDPWRIPSRHAREAAQAGDMRQMEQEMNLKYVIETRTKRVFIEASLEDFE